MNNNIYKFKSKYGKIPYHLVELITEIKEDGNISVRGERVEAEG